MIETITPTILNRYLKERITSDPLLLNVSLEGEVSSLSYSGGHAYFTLKDQTAEVRAIMFQSVVRTDGGCLKNGNMIVVSGSVDVYVPRGTYSINVKKAKVKGLGESYLEFLKVKEKLTKEGLFLDAHKKPIPKYPRAIGVITSVTGDAVNDIKTTINLRFPLAKVYLYNALVQGKDSSDSLIRMVKLANEENLADTLIIGRGGGSYEDLISFNSEELARTIYESHIPIISGVGHEADFTICDFVCDARGATPTAAAVLATPNKEDILKNLMFIKANMKGLISDYLVRKENYFQTVLRTGVFETVRLNVLKLENKLKDYSSRIAVLNPKNIIKKHESDLTFFSSRFIKALGALKLNYETRLSRLKDKLLLLNPEGILQKGYTIVFQNGKVVKRKTEVSENEKLTIRFYDGDFER